jgi:O-antigen ligase
VVLVTERAVAGVLFTAIAIGSFSGTLFGNVLGPSLALRRPHDERMRLLGPVLTAFVLLGAVFALAAPLLARLPVGKPALFWLTLGLSLAGSAVMIEAQRIRLQLFDASRGADLFGPDILRTMTLLIVAPAVAVFVGVRWLAGLYLLDAILTWVFYQSAARHAREQGALNPAAERVVQTAVAVLLLFPLFIQLIGAVYHSPELPMLDSGGAIRTLPLPISLVACFLGTVLLARFRQASAALAFVFFMFAAMALTSVIASRAELGLGSRKLLLLAQFLLPTFALILGQMFESGRASGITLARSFLWTLAIFVPLQLFLTLWQGKYVLTHEMVLFSVYQHRQYVPVIFVAAYLVALFTLWDVARERPLLIVLAVVMAIYAAVSYSTLALALLVLGAAFVLRRERASFLRLGAVAVLLATVALPLWYGRDKAELRQKYSLDYARTLPGTHIPVPENVSTRLRDWELYAGGTLDSVETALFGHAEPFERSASTSAHNYYFDFLYNFGLVGFLPFALLIGYTVWLIARNRHRLRGDFGTYGLAIVVLFLVLVDNNFKVTFRQPYPAVFSFFLWGLLLRRLRT